MMEYLQGLLLEVGLAATFARLAALTVTLGFLLLVCLLVYKIVDLVVTRIIAGIVKRTKTQWDDLIFEKKVIPRAAQLAPVIVISLLSPALFGVESEITSLLDKLVTVYAIIVFILIFDGLINLGNAIYQRSELSGQMPLTGLFQAVKLILFLIGGILVVAQLIGESPVVLFSGLGAMTAVLLLIFREAILGLVAGIQLSANDMVRPGDWIQMDQYGVDGDVIEITLTTVKVQNWDKTISNIPAYALIQDSFKNWRGMQNSGGRRIKRSINIDLSSIGFLDDEVLDRFSGYRFLENYLKAKREEIQDYNRKLGDPQNLRVDGRNLTNIGTFRAYCVAYLKNHPRVKQDLTMIVRQTDPTPQGLPLQIYCFTNTTAWVEYEGIQSDIFDHLLAVLPEFNLRAYQQPSGLDVTSLKGLS